MRHRGIGLRCGAGRRRRAEQQLHRHGHTLASTVYRVALAGAGPDPGGRIVRAESVGEQVNPARCAPFPTSIGKREAHISPAAGFLVDMRAVARRQMCSCGAALPYDEGVELILTGVADVEPDPRTLATRN